MTLSLEKDIEILKSLLRIEKQVNKKDQQRITDLETEIKQVRVENETRQEDSQKRVVELEICLKEKERDMESLALKFKEIKAHKKILKDEVMRLMDEIKELEAKLGNSQSAIQSIANFFQNNL